MTASSQSRRHFSCAVELSLAVLGGKWKTVVLAHLKQGPLRYGDLRARIPSLADKVLSERLRDLQAQGLVSRRKAGRRGSPSTYALTRRGQSLDAVLQALHDWGAEAASSLGVTIEAPRGSADELSGVRNGWPQAAVGHGHAFRRRIPAARRRESPR